MLQISTRHSYGLGLLEDLVNTQSTSDSTILVVCWAHKIFFSQLLAQILQDDSDSDTQEVAMSGGREEEDREVKSRRTDEPSKHVFLTPTLKLLASSKHIEIIFCPTVPTLRARLASSTATNDLYGSGTPRLVILDLLALHHGTSEFTLQGLSRTFASAVSAAHWTHSNLTLVECKDVKDPSNPHRGPRLWNQEIPLLSRSIKLGQEGAGWAGRSLTIRKIAGRWFTFEDGKEEISRSSARTVNQREVSEMLI